MHSDVDIVIALTEALITGISKKSADYKIVGSSSIPPLSVPSSLRPSLAGTYVTSPLNWAVQVGLDSPYQNIADLRGQKIGISRIGSGSQVMASYMALREGWVDAKGKVEKVEFEVLDTFKGLRDGVNDGKATAFVRLRFLDPAV